MVTIRLLLRDASCDAAVLPADGAPAEHASGDEGQFQTHERQVRSCIEQRPRGVLAVVPGWTCTAWDVPRDNAASRDGNARTHSNASEHYGASGHPYAVFDPDGSVIVVKRWGRCAVTARDEECLLRKADITPYPYRFKIE